MTEVRSSVAEDGVSHVVLSGRLDVDGVGAVELPLTVATVTRHTPAVVDMTAVDFLGSLGIGLLVRCAVSLQRSGAKFVLFGCQPLVKKTIETAKLTGVLPIAESEAAALHMLTTS
jgi:anti-anti-sigma factor